MGLVAGLSSAGAAGTAATGGVDAAPTFTRMVPGGQLTRLGQGTAAGETPPDFGPEAGTVKAPVANRSESSRARADRVDAGLAGIPASDTAVSAVQPVGGVTSFSGINLYQQRFEVASGNQWSLEPPDQALCVGNGFVFEAVNNAVAVYNTSGRRLALKSLNEFFGYPVELNRTTDEAGPKQTTDPSCLFDPGTGRFFLTILTFDADIAGNPLPSGTNSLDTAVSSTGDPTGAWSITHIDATDDGTNGTPNHAGCPCLGDYPHIGVDATGYYITTNEYPWFVDGFVGAQIYAMSKAQLASGAASVRVTQIDTSHAAPNQQPGFTVWPAQSPTAAQYDTRAGGTEYFLSTNAAAEANGTGRSSQLLTWSLTNSSSLASTSAPALGVHAVTSPVGEYAVPPPALQKTGVVPLADCLNLTACAKLVLGTPDKFKESEQPLDSSDTRMQQVTYANGLLYGSHGTAVDVGTTTAAVTQRAGVAWYVTRPATLSNGGLSTSVVHQGRLASAGNDFFTRRWACGPTVRQSLV